MNAAGAAPSHPTTHHEAPAPFGLAVALSSEVQQVRDLIDEANRAIKVYNRNAGAHLPIIDQDRSLPAIAEDLSRTRYQLDRLPLSRSRETLHEGLEVLGDLCGSFAPNLPQGSRRLEERIERARALLGKLR